MKIEDDIQSKISKCTVKKKWDPESKVNQSVILKEHISLEEFKKEYKAN